MDVQDASRSPSCEWRATAFRGRTRLRGPNAIESFPHGAIEPTPFRPRQGSRTQKQGYAVVADELAVIRPDAEVPPRASDRAVRHRRRGPGVSRAFRRLVRPRAPSQRHRLRDAERPPLRRRRRRSHRAAPRRRGRACDESRTMERRHARLGCACTRDPRPTRLSDQSSGDGGAHSRSAADDEHGAAAYLGELDHTSTAPHGADDDGMNFRRQLPRRSPRRTPGNSTKNLDQTPPSKRSHASSSPDDPRVHQESPIHDVEAQLGPRRWYCMRFE